MRDQPVFDFCGAETLAGHVDYVVDAAGDPIVAVFFATAAIASKILARIGLEVGVDKALMVAVDRAHLARPGIDDAKVAAAGSLDLLALGVDNLRDDAKERPRR